MNKKLYTKPLLACIQIAPAELMATSIPTVDKGTEEITDPDEELSHKKESWDEMWGNIEE